MSAELDSERWARIRELVADALEIAPAERAAWFASACGDDAELRRECESLLREDDRADERLGSSWTHTPAELLARSPTAVGAQIGRWRVVRAIGEGGMGSVYLAERAAPGFVQRAALKLVHGARMSSSVARRFELEQRALARLEHPGIARLIDAGLADDGVPFLAMELVEGAAIDQWCRERQADVAERVRLIAEVCEAVRYAHARSVVHRDLKPSNVLVDNDGRPRLIDFGIARVLEDSLAGESTNSLPRALTPRYASPEQVRGEPATTESDVYSLGVLLFELLVGASPYGPATRATREIERAVCDATTPAPSEAAADPHLARQLRGDLDAIVLRAMAKAPERRYASAAELGADLRRHLAGAPVLARPDSLSYRLATLVRRHRVGSALAVAFVAALGGGAVISTTQFLRAREAELGEQAQRRLAERRYDELREVASTLVFDAHDAIGHLPGSTAAREKLLEQGRKLLERLEQDTRSDRALTLDLARAHIRLADLLGRTSQAHLGRTSDARVSYERAIELARSLEGSDANAPYVLATASARLAEMLTFAGDSEGARALIEPLIAARAELARREPARELEDPPLSYLHERLYQIELAQGRFDEAAAQIERVIELLERAIERDPRHSLWRENFALACSHRAKLASAQREFGAAIEWMRRACAEFERAIAGAAGPEGDTRLVKRRAQMLGDLGLALGRAGERTEARQMLELALDAGRRLCDADPSDSAARADLATTYMYLGDWEAAFGTREDALTHHSRGAELRRLNAQIDLGNARAQRALAVALDSVGADLRKLERLDEALVAHSEANAVFEELAAVPGADAEARRSVAVSSFELGNFEFARGAFANARLRYARALGVMETLKAEGRLAARDEGVMGMLRDSMEKCVAAEAAAR